MKSRWLREEDGLFSRDVALAVGWKSPRKGYHGGHHHRIFGATRGPGVMRGGAGCGWRCTYLWQLASGSSRWDLQDTLTGMVLASFWVSIVKRFALHGDCVVFETTCRETPVTVRSPSPVNVPLSIHASRVLLVGDAHATLVRIEAGRKKTNTSY